MPITHDYAVKRISELERENAELRAELEKCHNWLESYQSGNIAERPDTDPVKQVYAKNAELRAELERAKAEYAAFVQHADEVLNKLHERERELAEAGKAIKLESEQDELISELEGEAREAEAEVQELERALTEIRDSDSQDSFYLKQIARDALADKEEK